MLNNKDGEPSTNRTVFFYGSLVCLIKLAFSGMTFKTFQIPVFTGSDFGMAVAALGAIYSLDKHVTNINEKDK